MANRPFAANRSRRTKPPCRRPKVAMGQDKQRKLHLKLCTPLSFVGLVPVRLLLSSMGVLYHVNGLLQRASNSWPVRPRPIDNPRNNCGTHFASVSFLFLTEFFWHYSSRPTHLHSKSCQNYSFEIFLSSSAQFQDIKEVLFLHILLKK